MHSTFAPTSQAFGLDLYGLLRELDPNQYREHVATTLYDRAMELQNRATDLMAMANIGPTGPAMEFAHSRLTELKQTLESHTPRGEPLPERWEEFRSGMVPAYERYTASLRHLDVHLPSLRPTNYTRNLYHMSNALFAMVCLRLLSEGAVLLMASVMLTLAWTLEIGRRIMPGLNRFLMAMMSKLSHPHEEWRVNSATWFCTACFILACMWDLKVASVGIVVLGFSDPAAAIFGRRYGKHQLLNGRTLEGTGAFIAVGTVLAWLWLVAAWGEAPGLALQMAFFGSVAGGIAELFSRKIDDNLSIPVGTAVGVLATLALST
jgi:dolichol kinase